MKNLLLCGQHVLSRSILCCFAHFVCRFFCDVCKRIVSNAVAAVRIESGRKLCIITLVTHGIEWRFKWKLNMLMLSNNGVCNSCRRNKPDIYLSS